MGYVILTNVKTQSLVFIQWKCIGLKDEELIQRYFKICVQELPIFQEK